MPKIRIIPKKKLQIKVFWRRILDKKVHEDTCTPPPRPTMELGTSKDDTFKYEIV